jgi:hypothetical protein
MVENSGIPKPSLAWSPLMRYTVASAINLAILIVGVFIGVIIGPHLSGTASANVNQAQSGQEPSPLPLKPAEDPNVDYVTPGISMGGPVVTSVFLSNRIACDRLEVNGFEPLRISDGIMSLLVQKGIASQGDINKIVASGKAVRPLRIRPKQ